MKINNLPRMFDWLLVTLVLIAIIAVIKPDLIPVSTYKLSLITMAAVVGYWIDRSVFPYARPDGYLSNCSSGTDTWETWHEQVKHFRINDADVPVAKGYELVFAVSMLRRAIIIATAMLSASLGM